LYWAVFLTIDFVTAQAAVSGRLFSSEEISQAVDSRDGPNFGE
jgi:hypothetical protein